MGASGLVHSDAAASLKEMEIMTLHWTVGPRWTGRVTRVFLAEFSYGGGPRRRRRRRSPPTCLSLSFAFPLPHTREDVTSRGMTEIWCSGMFIPAESTGGHSHTRFLSKSRSKGHDGPNCDT